MNQINDRNTTNSNKSGDITVKSNITWPTAPDKINDEFQSSLLDFSWNLFQFTAENKGNVLISPASVYLALGMTYNGADEETRQAMAKVLEANQMSMEELNEACRDYISVLRTMGEKTKLSVANSIWYRNGFSVSDKFLQTNANYYDATAQSLDFNHPSAIKNINDWVKKETEDTIDKIIDEINPRAFMFLINAVYFKSDWKEPFDAMNTAQGEFNSPTGKIEADFMNRIGEMNSFDKDGTKGVMLPYDDGRFQFFAILPEIDTDIRSFIHDLNSEAVYDYLTSVRTETIKLSLPKFETRFEKKLNDELSLMGMEIAFDPLLADFTLMLEDSGQIGEDNLYIGEVRHKTFCRIDELGTEASAVTSVEMRVTGAMMEPENQLILDRPFVYGIVDAVTGAPLFLGIMENPVE